MRNVFVNRNRQRINAGAPSVVLSEIEVSGALGEIRDINVLIDIQHTFVSDLVITLIGPRGKRVLLVGQEGGSENNFRSTVLDDDAATDIEDARAPFRGVFRPEGSLAKFDGRDPIGTWVLEIEDTAFADGGRLRSWALELETALVEPVSDYNIDVNFLGGLTERQQAVFMLAAARWSEIIVGDLPAISLNGQLVDDLLIDAEGAAIDGPGQVLGQAGPRFVRTDGGLPISGIMSFDSADLAQMEADGSLQNVIIHEMGHVIGLGTLWDSMGLLQGGGTANPVFVGENAMREWGDLSGAGRPMPVPVANTGGAGTRDGHWRETVFGNELMTGFLNGGINPLSRVTIAALQDMGYEVSYDAADDYTLPTQTQLMSMGLVGESHGCDHCAGLQGGKVRR
ncbi:MAG: proprotein convertase P-domain-containing protein [Algicola sp.]|nr:proprotein convertase P-domain-containing protein [Algicola sp.]